jgi:uncharacterized membrane protein
MNVHMTFAALPGVLLFEFSRTAFSMGSAGIALFVIGLLAIKNDFAQDRGLDKIVALANLCFAIPLAVFGAEHFALAEGISTMVPKYVPWHLFWAYFVGVALVAAGLSIATKIQVQWSGLLFGILMCLFVAMMDLPGALADRHNRIAWVLLCREMSFGAGAWALSAAAVNGWQARGKSTLVTIGRVIIGIAAIFYGVQEFLHPTLAPGVPLERPMDAWIPGRAVIGYLTGVILLVGGVGILLTKKMRTAATYLGTWIVLLVLFVYGSMLIVALLNPDTGVKVEGLNYFFDTLLFAGTILALARATSSRD